MLTTDFSADGTGCTDDRTDVVTSKYGFSEISPYFAASYARSRYLIDGASTRVPAGKGGFAWPSAPALSTNKCTFATDPRILMDWVCQTNSGGNSIGPTSFKSVCFGSAE